MRYAVETPWGVVCESCYSDSEVFQVWAATVDDRKLLHEQAPNCRYLTESDIQPLVCEDCGEPFEPIVNESERFEAWIESESDPYDVEQPTF